MSVPSTVSVVINTYNRAAALQETLSSLRFLRHGAFETIVVNGPSTDDTTAVLDRWRGSIKILDCPTANLSRSRNIGIAAAAGDVVAFIDDDGVPHPAWLDYLLGPYADPFVGGVGGFTLDNTGVRYQAAKTLCDRFGNAHHVSPFFDERPLNRPGTSHYPSLLGTNSSFRRSALLEIGGFDETFAYLLDETDVCLRLVDAGYKVIYAADAVVHHRFAPSHLRTHRRIPKSLRPSCVSKSYFIMRHGAPVALEEAGRQLADYRHMLATSNLWHFEHGNISREHWLQLDADVREGTDEGMKRGMQAVAKRGGDLVPAGEPPAMLPFPRGGGLTIGFISQGFPPDNEAGIARWTRMMAEGLSRRGHQVHVITRTDGLPSTDFVNGFWLHRISGRVGEEAAAWIDAPPNIAEWAEAARLKLASLASYGIDVVSFPIWDLEGLAVADLGAMPVVMSLHTTYALSLPFKPEWRRPIYKHRMIDRMIRRERDLLARLPVLLANSNAIVGDVEAAYGVSLGARAVVAPHGTFDPLAASAGGKTVRDPDRPFTVAFIGRFEPRKGFDIAVRAILAFLAANPMAKAVFAGDALGDEARDMLDPADAALLADHPRVAFVGLLARDRLDAFYASADVVVMPSRYESFGLVAIEAMAAGTPVIGLAVGGVREVIEDGRTGFLIDPGGDPHVVIAARLQRLLDKPDVLERLSRNARRAFERRFTIDRMAVAAEPAFRQAIAAWKASDAA
jgi:glycosyltransferase involved in cell wall biosynthesis/GT2 family glycosyltransferase